MPTLPVTEVSEAARNQAELIPAGEILEEVALWNGKLASTSASVAAFQPEAEKEEKPKKVVLASRKYVHSAPSPEIEAAVREYFSDIPIMIEVAWCESRFRQYDGAGEVLRGEVNDLDRGVMQINEGYHLSTATKLGYDILTLEGNMAYARYLYLSQGTRPWNSSSPCWGKHAANAEIAQK